MKHESGKKRERRVSRVAKTTLGDELTHDQVEAVANAWAQIILSEEIPGDLRGRSQVFLALSKRLASIGAGLAEAADSQESHSKHGRALPGQASHGPSE